MQWDVVDCSFVVVVVVVVCRSRTSSQRHTNPIVQSFFCVDFGREMRRSLVLAGTKTPPPRRRRRRWRWKKRSTIRGNRTDRKGRQEPRRLDRRYNMKGPTNQETTKAGGGREAAGSTAAGSRSCDTEKRPSEKRWYGSTEGPAPSLFVDCTTIQYQ